MKSLALIFKITFALSIFNYSFWSWIKKITGEYVWVQDDFGNYYCVLRGFSIFHPTNALTFVGYLYVIYEFTKRAYKIDARFRPLLFWAEIALGAAFSNLMDEMFFDPTKLDINEYIGFLAIIIIGLYNDYKRKKQA